MMYSIEFLSICFLVSISWGECGKLPPYMKKCNLNNNVSFVECARSNFDKILPHLSEGVKEFHLQTFTPFHLDAIDIEATKDFTMRMTDVDIYDLNTVQLNTMHVDTAKLRTNFQIHFPRVEIRGHYDIDGRILVLPIKGNGPANITLEQLTVDYAFSYPIVERKGKQYVELSNTTFTFKTKRLYVKLDNLFNGDKVLSDQMNQFLDTNWKEIEELIRPAMSQTVITVVSSVFKRITDALTVQELFEI